MSLPAIIFAILLTSCVQPQSSITNIKLKCGRSEALLKDDTLEFNVEVFARSDRELRILRDSSEENPFEVHWNSNVLLALPIVISPSYGHYITISPAWTPIRVRVDRALLITNIPKKIAIEIGYDHDGLRSNKILCDIPVIQDRP